MIVNSYRNLPFSPTATKYLIFILSSCITFALVLLFFDEGPPKPPFSPTFTSFDCRPVEFRKLNDRNGQVDVYFDYMPFIEYPEEYLPYFIKLSFYIDGALINYTAKEFKNITKTGNVLKVSVDMPYTGHARYAFYCLNMQKYVNSTQFNPPKIFNSELSYSSHTPNYSLSMNKVCLEYDKFLYFTENQNARKDTLAFDNQAFRFEFLRWTFSPYLKLKNVTETKELSLMISHFQKEPWKQLFYNVNPIAVEVNQRLSFYPNRVQFLFRNEVDNSSKPILALFSNRNLSVVDKIHCFSELIMTDTFSNRTINNSTPPYSFDFFVNKDFSFTRCRFERSKAIKNRIIIQDNYYQMIKSKLDDNEYEILSLSPDLDLINASKLVSSCRFLIGDHISVLCHLLWMNSDTFVIDMTSHKYSCNRWIDNFAKNSQTKVISLFNTTNCQCHNFECYPEQREFQYGIDFDRIREIIKENI